MRDNFSAYAPYMRQEPEATGTACAAAALCGLAGLVSGVCWLAWRLWL